MRFRPCIDIHNGSVKQIVGGSLKDEADFATDNFVSELSADFYANLYKKSGITGGHIIILNPATSPYYEADVEQAAMALAAYPGGLQIGGGITADNAERFLELGASHVIVTSYVFRDGQIHYENLKRLSQLVGPEHLVLDLSCRKRDGRYYIVTDRWQKYTDVAVEPKTLDALSEYCSEYLIHAVDVEGKASGIETELAAMLGAWAKLPMTYAGGVGSFADLEQLKRLGKNRIDVTVGSALDLFGGNMKYEEVLEYCK
ncbi:MAG: phosphoribosylformimino-5-aminoimidazole carboxamide ribotide isomerase [Wujia sp.]